MSNVSLGTRYEKFVKDQIEQGRFQNASEVVRAGLRLLEDHETSLAERRVALRRQIDAAFDDPRPSLTADEVFGRLEQRHADAMKAAKHGA